MNENEIMDIEYYPTLDDVENKEDYVKLPLSGLTELGLIGSTFIQQAGTMTTHFDMSGLYSVTVPKGMHLSKFKDGSGYTAMVRDKSNALKGQARLNKLDGLNTTQNYTIPYNPATTCMMIMLININQKLDAIQESQQDILSVLKTHEHGEIKGNIQYLYDILANFKTRCTDDQYKKEYRLKTQDIIQDSYKYIEIYKERLNEGIGKNLGLHFGAQVDKEINKLVDDFAYYRLSIFMFAYAHYVELLLGDYIDDSIIQSEWSRLEDLQVEYRKIYTKLYDYLDNLNVSSLDKKAVGVLGSASKGLGNVIHKIPVIEKGPIDEALVSLGNNIEDFHDKNLVKSLETLRKYKASNIDGFMSQYNKLNALYSGEAKILVDQGNVYVSKECLA